MSKTSVTWELLPCSSNPCMYVNLKIHITVWVQDWEGTSNFGKFTMQRLYGIGVCFEKKLTTLDEPLETKHDELRVVTSPSARYSEALRHLNMLIAFWVRTGGHQVSVHFQDGCERLSRSFKDRCGRSICSGSGGEH